MKIISPKRQNLTSVLLLIFYGAAGQVTITTSPDWKDALLLKSLKPNEASMQTTNYGTYPRLASTAWTHSGYQITYRSLMRFELGSIPPGSTVQSATLYLYSDPANTSGEISNQSLSGANSVYFQKVTQAWDASTVTWNTQPTTTTTNRVWAGATSTTANITVNLTTLIQDMVSNPASNFGLMMNLENEVYFRSRSYASTDHANPALHPWLEITFTDPVKASMDYIFGSLNQAAINTGILTDYGIDLADHTLYSGTITANNGMDMASWRGLYASLLSSIINGSSNMALLKTINQSMAGYWASYDKKKPIVDLAAMFIAYQTLRSDALTQNLLTVSNDRLLDVAGRTQSPYTTTHTYAVAPAIAYDADGQATFIFRSSLFINSSSKTFSNFQVDFGDGFGYQAMTSNSPITINYGTAGQKTLLFKMQFTDASVFYSHAKFMIGSVPAGGQAAARYDGADAQEYIFPRSADTNCPEPGFPNPESWQGNYSSTSFFYGATVTVEYGSIAGRPNLGCNPQLIRPLIVLEGFDQSNFEHLDEPPWTYNEFAVRDNKGLGGNLLVPLSETGNFIGDELDNAGYDIVFVDYNEGTGDIVRNAFLVENVIRWVNAHKINNPNTGVREKNVVMGTSMGGLVGRYAVCDMEKRRLANPTTNPDHEVRLLVTRDSPHRGSNMPLGLQAIVNDLAPLKIVRIGLSHLPQVGILGKIAELGDIIAPLDEAHQLLNEPASQQMLAIQDGRSNTFLNGAYRTMVTFPVGQTPSFAMRALSLGSECGVGQLLPPGGEIFYGEANFYANKLVFAFGAAMASTVASAGGTPIASALGLPHLSPGLGAIATVPFAILMPLAGKPWKTKLTVHATPSSGTNQAYTFSLGFEKKIWFINISKTPFSSGRNSILGSLPLDSSPGGYLSIDVDPISLNIDYFPILDVNLTVRAAPVYNFVATASALDITTTPLTTGALNSPYTNGSNPTFPSRFASFVTQEQKPVDEHGSTNNSRHALSTPRNANWFFNELQGLPQNQNSCSYSCIGTVGSPSISGPNTICNSAATFIINNASGATVADWNASSNITQLSGDGTLSFNVTKNASGNGSVTATLQGACGNAPTPLQMNVRVGGYNSSDYPVSGPTSICTNTSTFYNTNDLLGATNHTWFWPSNWTYEAGQGSRFLYVRTGGTAGGGAVGVRVANACDAGGSPSTYFLNVIYCGNYSLAISPNPTSSTLSVEIIEIEPSDRSIDGVEIIDGSGSSLKKWNETGKKLSFDIASLPKGYCFVKIVVKGEVSTTRILIE